MSYVKYFEVVNESELIFSNFSQSVQESLNSK